MKVPVLVALLQLPALVCTAAEPPFLSAQLQSAIDGAVRQYNVPGVSVTVSIPGESTPRNFVAGRTTIAPDSPAIDNRTLFQIGSVTKPLTAVLILMLEAQGLLRLDDPVGSIVHGYPTWQRATIRQLLNMTAGLKSYSDEDVTRFWCVMKRRPKKLWTEAQLLGLARSFVPNTSFAPGEGWNYSNTNYVLAGLIASTATNTALADLYHRLIFDWPRTGMLDTFYFPGVYPPTVLERSAHGYVRQDLDIPGCGEIFPLDADVTEVNGSWAKAAGGVVSTSDDLVRGFSALFQGRLLPPAQFATFTTLVSAENGQPVSGHKVHNAYGLGMDYDYTEVTGPFWYKTGETLGYNAYVIHFPCLALTYALTKNSATDDSTNDMGALNAAIVNTLLSSDEFATAFNTYTATRPPPSYCQEFDIHLPAAVPTPLDTPGPAGRF